MFKLPKKALLRIGEWLVSGDTGVSSETIVAIALGARVGRFDIPRDCGDFGRCYRLLKKVPELIDAMPLVAEVCPKWQPLVQNWEELTSLYELDMSDKKKLGDLALKNRCNSRIKELYDDCMIAAGFTKECGSWRRL